MSGLDHIRQKLPEFVEDIKKNEQEELRTDC